MCGGGGGGSVPKIVGDFLDITTQIATGGGHGFDENKGDGNFLKGFNKGVVNEVFVDAIKEGTGVTAKEEATQDARNRFNEEKERALSLRKESIAQQARDQLIASRLAAGARRSGNTAVGAKATKNKSSKVGSDESDFLGL